MQTKRKGNCESQFVTGWWPEVRYSTKISTKLAAEMWPQAAGYKIVSKNSLIGELERHILFLHNKAGCFETIDKILAVAAITIRHQRLQALSAKPFKSRFRLEACAFSNQSVFLLTYHPLSLIMAPTPAFSPSAFLGGKLSTLAGPSAAVSPRMCTAPQPNLADASTTRNQAVFRRSHGRESYSAASYLSDLEAASSAKVNVEATTSYAPRTGSADFASSAIRSLLGNAHVYESEGAALTPIVTRYETTGDVRELVRDVAMSDAFTSRFLEGNNKTRFVEICFKALLGRGPSGQAEVSEKIQLLADSSVSYSDYVDSFVGCEEYDARFGAALLPTFDAPGGLYPNGMVGFMSNVKVSTTTRGGNTDATKVASLSQGVLAAGEPAAPAYVTAGYSVPQYEPFSVTKPSSTLSKEYYSASLTMSPAVTSWAGLGTLRQHGPESGEWETGWQPAAKDAWKAGWAPAGKKYV